MEELSVLRRSIGWIISLKERETLNKINTGLEKMLE